jgi:hypothetical protein
VNDRLGIRAATAHSDLRPVAARAPLGGLVAQALPPSEEELNEWVAFGEAEVNVRVVAEQEAERRNLKVKIIRSKAANAATFDFCHLWQYVTQGDWLRNPLIIWVVLHSPCVAEHKIACSKAARTKVHYGECKLIAQLYAREWMGEQLSVHDAPNT